MTPKARSVAEREVERAMAECSHQQQVKLVEVYADMLALRLRDLKLAGKCTPEESERIVQALKRLPKT